MEILEAIKSRHSTRAFLDRPVDPAIIAAILEVARFSPSGANIQPWQVAVLGPETKTALTTAILAQRQQDQLQHVEPQADYQYYPLEWFDPYKSRRFACGMALYEALNINRDDKPRRQAVWDLNFHFFNAPAAMLLLIDKRLDTGSYFDCGMFLQTIMLAARHHGLATCPQASLADYPAVIRQQLNLPATTLVVCGLALGYPDLSDPINNYRTERATVDEFTTWYK